MSIHREYNIRCDRCEEMQGDARIEPRDGTPTELRRTLAAQGWVRIGREDFCKACAPVELDERG